MPDYLSGLKLAVSNAGSVNTSSFVTIDAYQGGGGAGNNLCRQATSDANDMPVGISQVGYNLAPGLVQQLAPGASYTPVAGSPGDEIQIFSAGDLAPLRLGAGGATAGALLGPDTSGNGIMVAVGSGLWYGAQTSVNGNSGDIIEVIVRQPAKA
jgi:hypothetical protein